MNIDCRSLTLYRYTHLLPSNRYSVICHTMQRKKDSKVKQHLGCDAYKAHSFQKRTGHQDCNLQQQRYICLCFASGPIHDPKFSAKALPELSGNRIYSLDTPFLRARLKTQAWLYHFGLGTSPSWFTNFAKAGKTSLSPSNMAYLPPAIFAPSGLCMDVSKYLVYIYTYIYTRVYADTCISRGSRTFCLWKFSIWYH